MPEFTEDWDYYKKNLIDDDYVKQAAPLLEEFNTKAGKMSAKDALLWLRDSLAAVRGKEVMNMGTSILKNAPSRIDFFQSVRASDAQSASSRMMTSLVALVRMIFSSWRLVQVKVNRCLQ